MPSLHAQYDLPVRRKLAGKEGTRSSTFFTDFIESLKTSSRKAKKVFEQCTSSVPKRRSMIRREDRRHSCKHETRIKSSLLNNESSSNNILSTTQTQVLHLIRASILNHLLNCSPHTHGVSQFDPCVIISHPSQTSASHAA